jgi:hypothetical protein
VAEIGGLYADLVLPARRAEEIEPLFCRVHANDLKRGEQPRAGEAGWNVPLAADSTAPSASGRPQTTQASKSVSKTLPLMKTAATRLRPRRCGDGERPASDRKVALGEFLG